MKSEFELDPSEEWVISTHAHWVMLVIPVMLYVLGWGVVVFLVFLGSAVSSGAEWLALILYLVALGVLVVIHHWLMIYLYSWQLSSWAVTTKRIIHFQFLPYVQHDTSFVMIGEIHEIDKIKHGIFANILNYGNVDINLAAIPEPLKFTMVPRPGAFVNLVETLHKQPGHFDLKQLRKLYYGKET
jgi:hypothetical protein